MLLKITRTGRKWGDKREPEKQRATLAGVACTITQSDTWEGPVEAGETGEYFRAVFLELDTPARDDRFLAAKAP